MGHFAQYRHRGGGTTAFGFAPPGTGVWSTVVSTTHVRVDNSAGPGGGISTWRAITYLTATPSVINETFTGPVGSFAIGSFAYSSGNVVGVRIQWLNNDGSSASPLSSEKTVTFP
jgi:hypothetical protein